MADESLRQQIEANIKANGGALVLPDPTIAVAGLQWLLDTLISGSKLSVAGASLSGKTLEVDGTLALFGVEFDVTVGFSGSPVGITITAQLGAGQSPNLAAIVTHFFPSVSPPDIDLSKLSLSASTLDTTFSVSVGLTGGIHAIPLGAKGVIISEVSGSFDYTASSKAVNADLELSANIAGIPVTLDYKPPADLALTGNIPRIDLGAAINAFLDEAFGFPSGFPAVSLRNSKISISKQGRVYEAQFLTQVDDWGALELDVRYDKSWGVAAGFALLSSFELSTISSVFGSLPLDGAKLAPSALIISSFTGDNPFSNPTLNKLDLVEGIEFYAELDLANASGALSEALGFASGNQRSLTIEGAISNPLSSSYIEATLAGTTTIPHTKIGIGDPMLRLSLAPAIEVRGTVHIPLKGQFIDLVGGLAVSTSAASLFVDADFSKLSEPLGFRGITLENIGGSLDVVFEPPGVAMTLAGEFLLGKNKADSKFALSFEYVPPEEVNPRLLSASFSELDITTMVTTLAPNATVPTELDNISFRNFAIYWADSVVTLPDGTTTQPGYGFNALMDFFGWTAYAALAIDSSKGFKGDAALSPITIGNGAFKFTGAGKGQLGVKDGGATLVVDTTSASFSFSGAADLLGITGSASGSFSQSGVSFALAANTGGSYNYLNGQVSGNFSSNLLSPNLTFSAGIAFGLDFTTPRLKFPGTSFYIGSLTVKAAASGSMSTSLVGVTFNLGAKVCFDFVAQHFKFTLPTITVQPHDLSNFGATVAKAIEDDASDVFSVLWSSAAGYIDLIAKGVLSNLDPNPLGVLMQVFHLSEADALKLLATVKGLIPHVDTSFPPHLDESGTHVDTHGDTTTPHVDNSGPHFDHHADVFGHGKHADTKPHVDTGRHHADTPHGDTKPHIDTPATHVDL